MMPFEHNAGDVGSLHIPGAPRRVIDFIGWLACDALCAAAIVGPFAAWVLL